MGIVLILLILLAPKHMACVCPLSQDIFTSPQTAAPGIGQWLIPQSDVQSLRPTNRDLSFLMSETALVVLLVEDWLLLLPVT